MPTEKTQLEMFQEDLDLSILGQILSPESYSETNGNTDTVEESDEGE